MGVLYVGRLWSKYFSSRTPCIRIAIVRASGADETTSQPHTIRRNTIILFVLCSHGRLVSVGSDPSLAPANLREHRYEHVPPGALISPRSLPSHLPHPPWGSGAVAIVRSEQLEG
eukprot:PhF_6_TR31483/c0_g1_i1/m.46290